MNKFLHSLYERFYTVSRCVRADRRRIYETDTQVSPPEGGGHFPSSCLNVTTCPTW